MKTKLTLILDRSGSMASISQNTEQAINEFIEEQKLVDGECDLTIIQFDDKIETVYDGDIQNTPYYNLIPRGGTSLYDAIGIGISKMKTDTLNCNDSPLVIIQIYSDGAENSSKEYKHSTIKNEIKDLEALGWKINFIGCNINAEMSGASLGFFAQNCVTYDSSKVDHMYKMSSDKIRTMRSSYLSKSIEKGCSLTPDELSQISCSYTNEEKESLK